MGDTKAVYSDRELLDWLYIGYKISEPHILLSLNALVYEVLDKYFADTAESDLAPFNSLYNRHIPDVPRRPGSPDRDFAAAKHEENPYLPSSTAYGCKAGRNITRTIPGDG